MRPGRRRLGLRRLAGGSGQAADLPVPQAVEHQGEQPPGGGHLCDVLASFPRRAMMACLTAPITESRGIRWTASMTAQRSIGDPCLVTWPQVTLTSDSRCRGVSPAQAAAAWPSAARAAGPGWRIGMKPPGPWTGTSGPVQACAGGAAAAVARGK